jgi:formylglycine-generating enzyme required for sulfatase activity
MRSNPYALHRSETTVPRRGISRIDVLLIVVAAALVLPLLSPLIARVRESARQSTCRSRITTLSLALRDHHDAQGAFPTAANWSVTTTQSLQLNASKQIARITLDNWAIQLLPYLGRSDLAGQFQIDQSIGADVNREARLSSPPEMACPSDPWNREDNPYAFRVSEAAEPIEFARGNYAISGGTQLSSAVAPNTTTPHGERAELLIQEKPRVFQLWGNGVAGINKAFSYDDFTNPQSTLIAIEELRAGVHPVDPRGVWALGQIGGSITWANGVQGDAAYPNTPYFRSDDVLGCGELHKVYGTDQLEADGMPCCHYVESNGQAATRSMHPGGVYVAFVDASTRFISEKVDPGLWHVLHSRKTPPEVLADDLEARLTVASFPDSPPLSRDAPSAVEVGSHELPNAMTNSIGMNFVRIAAGEFTMGVPDVNNDFEPPPECPAHPVTISRDFLLGECEVTEAQFHAVMQDERGGNNHRGPGSTAGDADAFSAAESGDPREHWPMTDVTWYEAATFCNQLSELPSEVAAGRRYRLPTEAEWEFACRGRASQPYRWNGKRQPNDASGEAAGIEPALPLAEVAAYPPNPLGFYDMRGNAWEWTADWFDRDYYARSRVFDPLGPVHGYLKVVRGSDWRFIGETCRHDYAMMPPWLSNSHVGFRVVCDVVNELPVASSDGNQ